MSKALELGLVCIDNYFCYRLMFGRENWLGKTAGLCEQVWARVCLPSERSPLDLRRTFAATEGHGRYIAHSVLWLCTSACSDKAKRTCWDQRDLGSRLPIRDALRVSGDHVLCRSHAVGPGECDCYALRRCRSPFSGYGD